MAPTQRRPTSILAALLVAGVASACGGAVSPASTSSSPPTSSGPTIGSASEVCEAYGRRHLPGQQFISVSLGTSPAMGLVAPDGTFQCTFVASAFPRTGPCVTDMQPCATTVLLDLAGTVRQYIGGAS